MPTREVTILIQAANQSQRVLNQLRQSTNRVSSQVRRTWEQANLAIRRSFTAVFNFAERGFRLMLRGAQRAASGIRATFSRVRNVVRSMFSLPGVILGGAVGGLGVRAIRAEFEEQRQAAIFRATRRNARERAELEAFAQRQAGGIFTQRQILGAAIAGRRIERVEDLQRLIQALRGAAASEGDLALAVVAVQRAMFEGEAELAERFGLLLREANLTEESNRLFRRKVTELTAAEKAEVVYATAIRQAAEFQNLENEMLQTAAGQWTLIRNRIDDFVVTLGQRLMPVLERVFNFLDNPLGRLRQFITDLGTAFRMLFQDIVILGRIALNNLSVSVKETVNDILRTLRIPAFETPLGRVGPIGFGQIQVGERQRFPGFRGGFREAFGGLVAPGGAARRFTPEAFPGRGVSPFQVGLEAARRRGAAVGARAGVLAVSPRQPISPEQLQELRDLGQQVRLAGQGFQDLIASTDEAGVSSVRVASQILGAWQQITLATDNMTVSVISAFAGLAQQILGILQQSGLLSAGTIGVSTVSGIGIGIAALGTIAGLVGQSQSRRNLQENLQRSPGLTRAQR